MISTFLNRAKSGEPVWIGEIREAFSALPDNRKIILRLTDLNRAVHDREIRIPKWKSAEERNFLKEYLAAIVFNFLSCIGGIELRLYLPENDKELEKLIAELSTLFQLDREKRSGYGKVISICDRMSCADGGGKFRFAVDSLKNYAALPAEQPKRIEQLGNSLRERSKMAECGLRCGLDVGGTDIKAAASLEGKLLFVHEFDWDPASYQTAEEILEPILLLARLLRLEANNSGEKPLPLKLDLKQLRRWVAEGEKTAQALRCFDSIGLSFPDVVVHDRILGGETPKTRGLRNNPDVQYEREFGKLSSLQERLMALCLPDGNVKIANDGNVAAYTAAVEMACGGDSIENGVFAHSLGTDLGTGWLMEDGTLPAMPLELYDFLLDLGSYPQRAFEPEDVRSVRNENSSLPDARKYLGQSAAFRLAMERNPKLLEADLVNTDGRLEIRREPEDRRKACLEHLMLEAERGNAEARAVFLDIGRHLGRIGREIDWLLSPKTQERYLYGRFVKHATCFALMQEGCAAVMPALKLIAANEELAFSPLMRALAERQDSTVAQFGQAIGAIYFGLTN